jgi:hypothetical protein
MGNLLDELGVISRVTMPWALFLVNKKGGDGRAIASKAARVF